MASPISELEFVPNSKIKVAALTGLGRHLIFGIIAE